MPIRDGNCLRGTKEKNTRKKGRHYEGKAECTSKIRKIRLSADCLRNDGSEVFVQGVKFIGMLFAASAIAGLFPTLASAGHAQSKEAAAPVVVQPGAPGEPSKTLPASTRAKLPPLSEADVEFMQGMIMHHGQAVEMTALIPSHTDNRALQALGARISRSQSDEIQFMKRWLAERGQSDSMAMPGMPDMDKSGHPMALMPGMLTPEQMDALRKAKGAEFDRLFLTGMIQHHTGALIMVRDLFETAGAGQDAELFDFATDVDTGQRAEIKIMEGMLEKSSAEEKR